MLATQTEDWNTQGLHSSERSLGAQEERFWGGQGAWSLVMSQGGGQEFTCCCGLDQGAKGAMRG